ncbi:hypothetical protein [Actinoplanes siamensis]|uniref:Tetratricopeptide repeat protein n=1 Tax=Actinoplanes siamensis TaxID=1223317 RepID=A0A919NE80_9ACTN|nr:hypothetical protein [Actinoplanes siamensis]GIF09627.1 hypothetical protein Asi03nite_71650 [Actinoplanes siamensis]
MTVIYAGPVVDALVDLADPDAGYPAASPRVSAILDLRAAEAYANDRDTTARRTAIDTAFGHLSDPSPQHGDPAWSYWATDAQAHAQAGYCYLKLEDCPRARQHLRAALSSQGDQFSREGALRDALLAATYARQDHPDLDKALHLGRQAVTTLSDQVTSAHCVKHVYRLVFSLHPYRRDPKVRHFTEQARPLLRAYAS